jgi:hypothetical protein
MTGRTFTASLKPAWDTDKITSFLQEMEGVATCWIINHDKDSDENGELCEAHTHIIIDYETPRKLTTISNLLQVETNFIELVKNKKKMLRYLTHKDDADKYQYQDNEVMTNNDTNYALTIIGNTLSDRDIADFIIQGRGLELMGVVSSSKLRTIQAFVHYDQSNSILSEVRALREQNARIMEVFDNVDGLVKTLLNSVHKTIEDTNKGLTMIATEIRRATIQKKGGRVAR